MAPSSTGITPECRIVDVVLFNDELSLLLERIKFLAPFVHRFVIGESAQTFSGLHKPLIAQNTAALEEFKAIIHTIEIPTAKLSELSSTRWHREQLSREYLLEKAQSLFPHHYLVFSDVDEVPSPEQLRIIATDRTFVRFKTRSLPMKNFLRYSNLQNTPSWSLYFKVKALAPGAIGSRTRYRIALPVFASPGCHMSFWAMTPGEISRKYKAYSHEELDKPHTSSDQFLEYCDFYQISHKGEFKKFGNGLLAPKKIEELSGFARFLSETQPNTVFSSPASSKLSQLIASYKVSKYIEGGAIHPFSLWEPLTPMGLFDFMKGLFLQRIGFYFVARAARHLILGDKRQNQAGLMGHLRRGIGLDRM